MVHAVLEHVQPTTSNDDARSDDPVPALGTVALVSGIVEDARDLVEALRDDISARLVTLGATLGSMLIAVAVFVVTGLVLRLAIATSLTALGAAPWVALWIVTLVAAAIGIGFVFVRARRVGPPGKASRMRPRVRSATPRRSATVRPRISSHHHLERRPT
jgi:hypothetical protein